MGLITLHIDNRHVTVQGADRKVMRALDAATSYFVAGYYFSPAFRKKYWDGKEHLLTYNDRHGFRAPIGLLPDIRRQLRDLDVHYKVKDNRRQPERLIKFPWNDAVQHRAYQIEAIAAITDDSDPDKGRGILKMPIRSGKTKTAAGVIRRLGVRSLFIVPSQMLLHQTMASLSECFPGLVIGQIGDSVWDEGAEITVATIQTLAMARGGTRECPGNLKDTAVRCRCGRKRCKGKRTYKVPADPRFAALRTSYGLVIFDEVHHLTGDAWHKALMDIDAMYRLGLSATVYLDSSRENERGIIWLKACCGDLKVDISTSRLIQEGYLMKPTVRLYKVVEPDLSDRGWSQSLARDAIHENAVRNALITRLVKKQVEAGLKVLVVANRLNHVAALQSSMLDAGIAAATIVGNDTTESRDDKVDRFKRGRVQVLVGTVLGEGVDIPEIECVINAEGGRDVKATVQRMRNLTPSPGKDTALFIDFIDMTNPYFAGHSLERMRTYRSEPEFDVSLAAEE